MRKIIDELREEYPCHESFNLKNGENIRDVVKRERVPNGYGIYVIYDDLDCEGEVVYIGKAGTIRTDGQPKEQGLARRLCNKQDGKSRNSFFGEFIRDNKLRGLSFEWFETFSKEQRVIPAFAEANIMQVYFDVHGCLPRLNKSI